MMRVLFDTDVILDVLLDRTGFVEPAAALWEANADHRLEGYISAMTPVNVFYIARKLKGAATARQVASRLLAEFRVCPVDLATLRQALPLPIADYEDAVQVASARIGQMAALVTRNLKDYTHASFVVLSPVDLVALLTGTSQDTRT